jgi:hypothetical protein
MYGGAIEKPVEARTATLDDGRQANASRGAS